MTVTLAFYWPVTMCRQKQKQAWKHLANIVDNNWLKFERDIFIGLGAMAFLVLDVLTLAVLWRPF